MNKERHFASKICDIVDVARRGEEEAREHFEGVDAPINDATGCPVRPKKEGYGIYDRYKKGIHLVEDDSQQPEEVEIHDDVEYQEGPKKTAEKVDQVNTTEYDQEVENEKS